MKLKADYKNLCIDKNMIGVHQTKLFWMMASVCEIKGGQIDNVFRKYYKFILSKLVISLLSIWNVYLDMRINMINVYCFLLTVFTVIQEPYLKLKGRELCWIWPSRVLSEVFVLIPTIYQRRQSWSCWCWSKLKSSSRLFF